MCTKHIQATHHVAPRGCQRLCVKYPQAFPLCVCTLHVIKNWRQGRFGGGAGGEGLGKAKFEIECTCTTCMRLFYRIWDIECGACLKLLEGHDDLVR